MAMNTLDELRDSIRPMIAEALSEAGKDVDLDASRTDFGTIIGATIVARESLSVCGRPWVDEVFAQLDDTVHIDWYLVDGQSADAGDVICKLVGPTRAFLLGERSALNYLGNLSSPTDRNTKPADFSMILKID